MTFHCVQNVVLILAATTIFDFHVTGRQLYVSHDGYDNNECGDLGRPCKSLHFTVNKSKPYDTICLDGSKLSYNECGAQHITIKWTLSIRAYNASYAIIDCENKHSNLFYVVGRKDKTKELHFSLENIVLKRSAPNDSAGPIALANANLELRNSKFEGNGMILHNPWRACVSCRVLIHNCTFQGNVVKHHYQPGILLTGCNELNLNIINATMKASPMRIQADYGLSVTINRLDTTGKFSGRKIITSLVEISLGKNHNHVVISNSLISNQEGSTQSSVLIRVFGSPTNPSSIHLTRVSFKNITGTRTDGSALGIVRVMPTQSEIKHLNLQVTDCEFLNNSVVSSYYGGAIYLEKISMIKFNQCRFQYNRATNGGAFSIRGGTNISLTNCVFNSNEAQNLDSALRPSHGGAMFIYNAEVTVFNSIFTSNKANAAGSTFYLKRDASINIQSSDMTGDSSGFSSLMGMAEGNCFTGKKRYSSIQGSTFHLLRDGSSSGECTGMQLMNTQMKNTNITCPPGSQFYQLSEPSTVLLQGRYKELLVACRPCGNGMYSLQSGSSEHLNSTHYRCLKCPTYADCHDGILRAKANFWGHTDKEFKVTMVRCPIKYCCPNGGCSLDKICEGNRTGSLCGRCKDGYTIPVNHNYCVPVSECNAVGLWLSVAFSVILYAFVMIFFPEITRLFLKVFSSIQSLKQRLRQQQSGENVDALDVGPEPSAQQPAFSDQTPILHIMQEADVTDEDTISQVPESSITKHKGYPQKSSEDTVNSEVVFTGGFRLLFHLYQVSPLFYLTFTASPSNFHPALDSINAFFHFLPILLSGNMCPHFVLTFALKQLVQVISVVATPLLILLLYILISSIVRLYSFFTETNYSRFLTKLKARFVSAVIHVIIITYVSVVLFTFKLTSCVQVGEKKVMFFDGSISCGQWWQWLLLAFAVMHLFPLSLVFFMGTPLLAQSKISLGVFICSCLIPLPMSIYLCITSLKECNAKEPHKNAGPMSNDIAKQEVLKTVCQSVVKSDTGSVTEYKFSCNHHESIWLIAKFVFVVFYSTLSYKPLLCALVQLIWFGLFVFTLFITKGHTSQLLRRLELICIILLGYLITMNLIPAAIYDNGTKPSHIAEGISFIWPTVSSGILILISTLILFAIFLHLLSYLTNCVRSKEKRSVLQ